MVELPDDAIEAAACAISGYSPEQYERWRNTSKGQQHHDRAVAALTAAYPLIAARVRAEAAEMERPEFMQAAINRAQLTHFTDDDGNDIGVMPGSHAAVAIIAARTELAAGSVPVATPELWGPFQNRVDWLRDQHARYHDQPGNMLGRVADSSERTTCDISDVISPIVSHLHHYERGSFDLHFHFILGSDSINFELCARLHKAPEIPPTLPRTSNCDDLGVCYSRANGGERAMFIGVLQATESMEGFHAVRIGNRGGDSAREVIRLLPLDECDSVWRHSFNLTPEAASTPSVLGVEPPVRVFGEDISLKDGESGIVFSLCRGDCDGKVIQGGSEVEKEIPQDDGDFRPRLLGYLENVSELIRIRYWWADWYGPIEMAVAVGPKVFFKLHEVLLSPADLELPRISHDLPSEPK